MKVDVVKTSKFLSLVLRHQPQKIGLTLDSAGWVNVQELLAACNAHGKRMTLAELEAVVRDNDKQRFAFSEDGLRIRASQGHSVEVELQYEPAIPPPILYHGTVKRFLASIKTNGLVKGNRHHVHLSADVNTAENVGNRRGKAIVLEVLSGQMHEDGYQFFLSANGVWMTDTVPPQYLTEQNGDDTNKIKFYRVNDEYGCFSNFSPHPFKLDGKVWPTSEHYFQAKKFLNEAIQEEIRREKSPMIAARMGRDRKKPLRRDWEAVKDEIMLNAIRAKFAQHDDIRAILLSTGEAKLIEHTTNDRYWADGGDGSGRNRLGEILMQVRARLRENIEE
jgi:putative RNA 2'-phosphotransferase